MISPKHIAKAAMFTHRCLQLAQVCPQPSWSSTVMLYPEIEARLIGPKAIWTTTVIKQSTVKL